ncbi:hypothetical protein V7266_18340 [Neobacillus drentensis]|uniref:hypothetical protein n=1 Tax=Neobacillus drentensis TaxID=220684 RepID=UPI0030003CB7
MNEKLVNKNVRRKNFHMNSLSNHYNFLVNPWIPTLWSFIFPGFGHLLTGMYIEAYLLMIWEIIVNTQSHLNQAILYSFTGNTNLAKQVLNLNWALMYIAVYVFAAWDSYRSNVDTNNLYVLAEKDKATIKPMDLSGFSIVYLEKYKPKTVAIWTALMPGLGQILVHKIPTGFFILGWWMFLCYRSNLWSAIYYTFFGSFDKTISILKPEWFLFIPSLYIFAIYDAYCASVELNKVFKLEQAFFF